MTRTVAFVGALSLCALWESLAYAHHSFAMFDDRKLVTLHGTLYSVEWKNPHGWFWIQVPDGKGGNAIWGLEGAGPAAFTRQGFTKQDFVVGSKVAVDLHPLKDGRTGGQFLRMTFPDGRVVGDLKTAVDNFRDKGYVQGDNDPTPSGSSGK